MEMESTQDPSPDQRPTFILYDFINRPSNSNVSIARHYVVHPKTNEKLDLSLSLSWSSRSNKKRKVTHNPESASSSSSSLPSYNSHHHIPKKPFNNRNAMLLGSQGTLTLTQLSLRLSLSPPDPFVIKKTLEESDVNDLARLMLAKGAVEAHVLAHWDDDMKERLKEKEGVVVKVWDLDRDMEHDMKMKIWGRSGSVVINDRWINKFVRRRGLTKGDRIGLCWDKFDRRLVFSVLEQAPIDATPISIRSPNHDQ